MALAMPPIASPATSGRCGAIAVTEIVPLRVIIANDRVTRLIIRLSGTADFASKPTPCIRTGSRNSPPPNPIRPARPPIGTHQPNDLRKNGHTNVRCILAPVLPSSSIRPRQPQYLLGDEIQDHVGRHRRDPCDQRLAQ